VERLLHRTGLDDVEVERGERRPSAATTPPAALMLQLQRGAGNAAVARAVADATSVGQFFSQASQMLGQAVSAALTVRLTGSVGRGGDNEPSEVQAVRARLAALGFGEASGEDIGPPIEAITRYQGEVVGARHPDGRIDPGGRTLRVLNAGKRAPEPEPATAAGAAPAAPPGGPAPAAPPAGPVPIPYPNTDPAAGAASAPSSAPARAGSADGAQLLASAGPAVGAVSAETTRLSADLATLLAESRAADKDTAKANKARPKGTGEQPLNLGQETGPKRDRLVDGIEKVRAQIGALTPASTGLDEKELRSVRAELYRRADHLSPYYYQMVNANILYDSDTKGGGRTCNVTSLSMCLEAMGKSFDDFKGDTGLLAVLAEQFKPALTDASDKGSGSLEELRLPDFLQLLAVAECMNGAAGLTPQDPGFDKAVEKGRGVAVNEILKPAFFVKLTSHFGVEVDQETVFDGRMRHMIDLVGEVNRKAIPAALKKNKALKGAAKPEAEVKASVVEYFDQKLVTDIDKADKTVTDLQAAPPGKSKSAQKKLDNKLAAAKASLAQLKDAQASGIYERAIDPKALDELQPLDVYAAAVEEGLGKHLDAGHQIVGHVHSHFIRVEGVEDEGVLIDDPGSHARHDFLLKWRESREIGGFTRFTVLK
jgi:hypothetical protein